MLDRDTTKKLPRTAWRPLRERTLRLDEDATSRDPAKGGEREREREAAALPAWFLLAILLLFCSIILFRTGQADAADSSHFDQATTSSAQEIQRSTSFQTTSDFLTSSLTREESVWLREHPIIRVVQDPGWPPIEFVDEKGANIGITGDYLKLIEQRLGVRFERIGGLDWQEAYDRLRRWEIDMTTSVAVTPERTEFWAFTKPYMKVPIVILAQMDVTFISSMRELSGKTVAVVDGYAVCDWIPRDFPDIQLIRVKTTREGLDLLQHGRVFAYIDNMLVVSYYMAKQKVGNVKIAGETPYVNAQSMAVRKDWTILAGILQKTLDSISETERDQIYQRWVPIRYEHGFNYTLLWQALAIFTMIVLSLIVWNQRLSREIRHRKKAEAALRESEMRTRDILDNVGAHIFIKDTQYRYTYVNNKVCDLFGLREQNILGKGDDAFFSAASVEEIMLSDRPVIEEGKTADREEKNLTSSDTPPRTYWTVKIPLRNDNGEICGLCGISTDITEHRQAELALEEEVVRRRTLMDQSRDGIVILDQHGKVFEANRAFAGMLGYSMEEAAQLHVWDWDAQMTRGELEEAVRLIDASGDLFTTRHRRKDGSIYDVEITSTAAVWEGQKLIHCVCRDISDRLRSEEALRKSEEKMRSILRAAPVGIGLVADRVIMEVNDHLCAMTGYMPEELLGKSARMLYPTEEDYDEVGREKYRQIAENGVGTVETKWQCKDGVVVDVLLSSAPIQREDLSVGVTFTALDITDRKRAEKALKENEELYRTLVEASPDAIIMTDTHGILAFASQNALRLFDYSHDDEVIGRSVLDWVFPEEREVALINIGYILTEGAPRDKEYTLIKRDGTRFIGEVNAAPFRSADGNPKGMLLVTRDITERKQAENGLREAEKRYRTLFEGANDATFIMNPAGLLLECNRMTLKIYGCEQLADIIGRAPWDFSFPQQPDGRDSREKSLEMIKAAVEGRPQRYYWQHVRKDRTPFDAEVSLNGMMLGNRMLLQAVVRDVSEHKQAEEDREKLQAQLHQAQKMESVGRLAGGVAHDFNNMLGVILGHTEMAMEQVNPAQSLFTDLMEIEKAARRSTDLTRQLLAFARKQTVAPKVLDLNETVEGMLKMLRRLIGEDIDLAWLPGKNLWAVKVDPAQIDQILANLCINARDAIAGVGKITIETGTTTFDEAYCADHPGFVPGEFVLLAVSDNGCGMDKDTLGKVFEPFFTTKGIGQGTGLGLATIYGIVKQNNGFINVYSEPGQGTTFKIYIPRHVGQAGEDLKVRAVKTPKGRGETVLLVEDEPTILTMTTKMLERQGYTVMTASKPSEAMRLADEHTGEIHLLITDVVMPEMNGRDLAQSLLSLHPNIKSLFMSGYTANIIAHHGVLDEGVHFIQKPFSKQDLAAKVREVLGE
jgi:two-component system, cell cycle sensor histidine kinase and response regulator CckA